MVTMIAYHLFLPWKKNSVSYSLYKRQRHFLSCCYIDSLSTLTSNAFDPSHEHVCQSHRPTFMAVALLQAPLLGISFEIITWYIQIEYSWQLGNFWWGDEYVDSPKVWHVVHSHPVKAVQGSGRDLPGQHPLEMLLAQVRRSWGACKSEGMLGG